jgi:23S rRNA pseudouridine2605 synthase
VRRPLEGKRPPKAWKSSAKRQVSPRTGLARALSKRGFCSRTQAEVFIRSGRVTVNGFVRRDPETPVHLDKDQIEIDGKLVAKAAALYLMLNKPRGVVTTASDERGRPTVYNYIPAAKGSGERAAGAWLAPVGRLDKASEGLLLMTNDSRWAARILAPETHLDKTYHVQINALPDDRILAALRDGIISEGETLRVKKATVLRRGERNSWLEIVLDEGKNRQIRRMLEALGIEVLRLIRVAVGPLLLGDLPKGDCRTLTSVEKLLLDQAMK